MTVTDMTPKGRQQLILWIDGEKRGFLERRDVNALGLEIGSEVTQEQWQKITAERILPRGKKKALELLERQDRTTRELHDRLIAADYTEEQTWDIIAYVVSFHYIDEARYAYQFILNHAKTKSRREITQVLVLKGVDKALIEQAYTEYEAMTRGSAAEISADDSDGTSVEEAAVRRFVSQRVHGREMTREKRKKVLAGLLRKGFSYPAIRAVLSEYTTVDGDFEEDFPETV
ncbi:MAG: RecX family transcriptional regulator [Lachnospiraceae bacterium]|nr:RecX family transcriptional regulator [Lachnospiraceae bacterium]